jgi:hypothetical protein
MKNKIETNFGSIQNLLQTLKENNVTFTSGHEVEINEDGKWVNKRRIF